MAEVPTVYMRCPGTCQAQRHVYCGVLMQQPARSAGALTAPLLGKSSSCTLLLAGLWHVGGEDRCQHAPQQ